VIQTHKLVRRSKIRGRRSCQGDRRAALGFRALHLRWRGGTAASNGKHGGNYLVPMGRGRMARTSRVGPNVVHPRRAELRSSEPRGAAGRKPGNLPGAPRVGGHECESMNALAPRFGGKSPPSTGPLPFSTPGGGYCRPLWGRESVNPNAGLDWDRSGHSTRGATKREMQMNIKVGQAKR